MAGIVVGLSMLEGAMVVGVVAIRSIVNPIPRLYKLNNIVHHEIRCTGYE